MPLYISLASKIFLGLWERTDRACIMIQAYMAFIALLPPLKIDDPVQLNFVSLKWFSPYVAIFATDGMHETQFSQVRRRQGASSPVGSSWAPSWAYFEGKIFDTDSEDDA
jgi:hypothetical protein